jgi:P4 family phage/plasmid primase-like protien
LREVFAGTKDAEERIAVVCEALGYSMTTSTRLEKFFMLIGKGANGKSVLLAVLTALLGRDQTSAIQPSQFENQFQRAHLHGKLANIVTEIAEGAEIADAQLKSLVSGEMTTAEHKFKSPFEFVPVAKHWFGTNHMPHTRDFSDALFRRATILEFPNKFDGDKCDVHLGEKLTAELPGILNLALAGLGRLTERRAFTSCASSVDMAKKWRVEADQVAQFVDECCAPVAGAAIESAALYHKYDEWADGEGIHRKLNRKNFTTRLENQGFHAGKGTGGKRMIYGILLQSVY